MGTERNNQVVVRASTAFARAASDQKQTDFIVSGEVIVPAPDFKDGQVVTAEQLEGVIHYDGAYVTVDDTRLLSYRYLSKRCSFDVSHDRVPRGCEAVASFVAEPDSKLYRPNSWVLSARPTERELREAIERGTHTAWSVEFTVSVTPVVVLLDSGREGLLPLQLMRFSNPDPWYVSFTGNPATGIHWTSVSEEAQRTVRVAARDAQWDAEGAAERLLRWATVDTAHGPALSVARCARVFAGMREHGLSLPYADLFPGDDAPSIVPAALRSIAERLDGGGSLVTQIRRHVPGDLAPLLEEPVPNATKHLQADFQRQAEAEAAKAGKVRAQRDERSGLLAAFSGLFKKRGAEPEAATEGEPAPTEPEAPVAASTDEPAADPAAEVPPADPPPAEPEAPVATEAAREGEPPAAPSGTAAVPRDFGDYLGGMAKGTLIDWFCRASWAFYYAAEDIVWGWVDTEGATVTEALTAAADEYHAALTLMIAKYGEVEATNDPLAILREQVQAAARSVPAEHAEFAKGFGLAIAARARAALKVAEPADPAVAQRETEPAAPVEDPIAVMRQAMQALTEQVTQMAAAQREAQANGEQALVALRSEVALAKQAAQTAAEREADARAAVEREAARAAAAEQEAQALRSTVPAPNGGGEAAPATTPRQQEVSFRGTLL